MCVHHICDCSHTCQHYPVKVQKCMSVSLTFARFACKCSEIETSRVNREDWISGLSHDINQWSCSAVLRSLQAPSTHSVMTRSQLTLRSSSFSRSLVDSSCPNHQTPCWATVERYKCTKHTLCANFLHLSSFSVSLSHTHTHKHTHALLYSTSQRCSACSQQKYIQHHKTKH